MSLILYDMNVLSLVSTVILVHSKAVIEHEIIFIKMEIIFVLILIYNRELFYNVSSCTWTITNLARL